MTFDIAIEGSNGFYAIHGKTDEGREWVDQNVQGAENGSAFTDGSNYAQDIGDGALQAGLTVSCGGLEYLGDGETATGPSEG